MKPFQPIIISIFMTLAFMASTGAAIACCSYGCCDCSCIALVDDNVAQDIINNIESTLSKNGYHATQMDIVIDTEKGKVVIKKNIDGKIQQPNASTKQ